MSQRKVIAHAGGSAILDIIAIIIGAVYSGSSCVNPSISFDLGKWVLYGGIGNLIACCLIASVAVWSVSEFVKLVLAKLFFCVAWFIVGCILITGVTSDCKERNYTIYVMAIIYLVFLALWSLSTKVVIAETRNSATTSA